MNPSDRYRRALLSFVALDFETANERPSSACAVGLVRVGGGQIVDIQGWKLRPEGHVAFRFTHLHGIDAAAVADAPDANETA